ncbi:MAG: WG repeat-containing protein [Leptospiraceae bacterium]|nr:WG repeat-containing protein [Leptospiraceae bacterium]
MVIKPQFENASSFSEGMAAVVIDYKDGYGFIEFVEI